MQIQGFHLGFYNRGPVRYFFPSMLLYALSNSPPSGIGSLGGLLKNTGLLK